ncbi:MAG: transcriptional initiation protein Tat [Kiritimatiellaeota bacterium]|nr:transcriptional initiation protein Tat [Kiritimatiellota bacterium]
MRDLRTPRHRIIHPAFRRLSVRAAMLLFIAAGTGEARIMKRSRITSESHDQSNRLYAANRPPLAPSPLVKLPVGAVRPSGWLRHQLELMANGFTGHLESISPFCKFKGSAWADPKGQGNHGWEELPYWLRGFVDLGYLLKDKRIIEGSRRWVEAVLAGARPDGWFGPESNRRGPDLWPNMIMLYALRSYHEATGDPRVLKLMTGYFRWLRTVPFDRFLSGSWQKWRAGDNLDSIYWLYNRTGEKWLLEVARINHERTADWSGGFPTWHGVNICECFREPAQFRQQFQDPRYLAATERTYDTVMGLYGQVPGGMFGADENCRRGFSGPRQAAESCSMVEFMHSFEMLTAITGDPTWADRCEDVAFNSLPCAMTPDLKGLHYLTAPNQIQLDRRNKSPMIQNGGDMFSYNPYGYRCCQHNVAMGWPYFVESLWMAAPGNGLAAVMYAPCTVSAKVAAGQTVQWTEETDYPFGETVTLRLRTSHPVEFPLFLRIPRWCTQAGISVNGKVAEKNSGPGWVRIVRFWKDGDVVRLDLSTPVAVRSWKKNRNAVSVDRGPLTYSLRIGEKWSRWGGTDEFPAFEVFPTTPWNYGLVFDPEDPTANFRVEKAAGMIAPQPFTPDAAPVRIHAKARRVPAWKQEENGLVGAISDSPVRSDEPTEDVVLVPMGCARLRISAFPWIGTGPNAEDWHRERTVVIASHCWESDTPTALTDGMLPKSSGDERIPRLTWWDHRGTREWVELHFSHPRKLEKCEVYWFDDTGVGQCRIPKSWRVLYWIGREWRPVDSPSGYGTEKDRFNTVQFDPIETSAVRIEVTLRPHFSGGILEVRFPK